MPNDRRKLGTWGENLALELLTRKGHVLMERNVRTDHGELDLVTRCGRRIVFTEVKTRRTTTFGPPEASVTPAKQQRLVESALSFLAARPHLDAEWQIDVIAVRAYPDRPPELRHIENAVTG